MLDSSGLIYLRARYYDPSVSRFVQIDTNYDGEKGNVASQNKYVYTLNNPYKYVDKNGNWSLFKAIGNVVNKVVKTVKKVVSSVVKVITNCFVKPVVNAAKYIADKLVPSKDSGGNSATGQNTGNGSAKGSAQNKPTMKNVSVVAKCPSSDAGTKALDYLQTFLDLVGFVPAIGDICDVVNAVISYLRSDYLGAAISVACAAFSVVADSVLKPLKWVAKSADEFVAIAVKKVSGLYDGIMGLLKRADNWVDGNWMLPRNVELAVCEGISDFDGFLKVTFKSADDNVAKEALEEGSEKLLKAEDIVFSDKFKMGDFNKQVVERGWDNQKIADTINNPVKIKKSINKYTGNEAIAYYINDIHYVVRDEVTKKIIQISDFSKKNWKN